MSVHDFLDQNELDDLPDDPAMAFATFSNNAQRRLNEITSGLDPENQYDWNRIEELQHSFMNIVVAAAKRFEIEPFYSMDVPTLNNYRDQDHRQFRADLDHYMTQLMLDNSIRARRDTVEILPKSKDQIRSYVHGLRGCVENSNMAEPKREALLKKLDAFEVELERRRLSLMELTKISLYVMAIPGSLWASSEVATKLVNNIMQVVGEAKVGEDEKRQIAPIEPMKALLPPRKEKLEKQGGAFDDDIDDDVPF